MIAIIIVSVIFVALNIAIVLGGYDACWICGKAVPRDLWTEGWYCDACEVCWTRAEDPAFVAKAGMLGEVTRPHP